MNNEKELMEESLKFDSRDGTYHFERPDGAGRKEYSQNFPDRNTAILAYRANKLIYID